MPLCASRARAGGCRVADPGGRPEPRTPAGRPGPEPADPRRTGRLLLVAVAVVVLDQLTKAWALSALADGPIGLIGPLRLLLTRNTAGAFGLGGAAVPFLAVAALILVAVMASSGATRSAVLAVAVGLVLGGAIGNLVDRLFRAPGRLRGAVVDFIDLQFWPVFNVADMAITCGCVLLIWAGWRST